MGIDAPSATTVLVVDPDTLSRALLVAALRQDGHDVAEAAGGREALRLLRERRFDAAVTELTLARPGRDGFRLLRRIRADPTLRRIPLLVVSEAAQMGTVLRCQRLGASAHLAKPFDPVQLRRLVLGVAAGGEDQPPVPAPPPSPAAAHVPTASSALPPIDPAGQGTFGFVRSLTRWLRPYRRPVVLFCALLTLSMAIASAFPLGFKLLADRALLQHDLRALVIILAVLGIAELVCAAADLWRDHLLGRITHRVLNDMRFGVLRALQRLSLGFYGRVSAGEITSRFTTDVASVENGLHTTLPLLLCQCVLIPCQLVLLFLLEWRLALLVTVGLYLSYRSERWVEPHAERAGHQARADQAVLTSALEENIQAQPVVKMFRLQGVLIELAKRHLLRLSRTAGRATFLSYQVFRLPNRLNSVLNVVVLAVGAWLVFAGKMTLGSLVSFQLLLSGLALAAAELTTCLPPLLQAGIGLQRIQQLLEQPAEVRDDPAAGFLPRPKSAITLNDVSFGYTADRLNLSGVSMNVPLGQSVMLVGPSGCGKSTVLNLLMRLYDPRSGSVCVDGIDLRTITQDSLREQLGVVLQENFLFNTSVRENIRIGRREATDEEVEAAARTAEIHEAILKLPGGYDCVVGERGGKLSGGQRQRVAIARALLSDPAVLLLDEATSALDPATADSINRSLARISEGRTVFSVTHRLESAPAADCVFVFRDGRLVERGPHQELLAANGLYAVLWRKQNGFSLSADGDRARVQAARLRDIPILAALDDATLATVADLFVTERFGPKRLIVQQGDAADRFYIIVRGRVAISKTGPSGAEETLPPLEDGDHFGEIALIKRSTRTATVRTITDCVFLTLQAEHFLRLVDADAGLRQKMDQVIEERP